MNIISGANVDLIYPFPASEVRRVFGWSRCYRTFIDSDALPIRIEQYTEYISKLISIPSVMTWGVIDKNRLTNDRHEAPLVGVVMFEATANGGFVHFASARKAFKMNLLDEALAQVVQYAFEASPSVLRIGCHVDERNYPAKALLRSSGFRFEGTCRGAFVQHGEPRDTAMFGITRADYETRYVSLADQVNVPLETTLSQDSVVIELETPNDSNDENLLISESA